MSRIIRIKATEPQKKFHQLTCKYPLLVAGVGSGKTETMINQAFMDALLSPACHIGLYEPTYDLVRLILAPRLTEKLTYHGIDFTYNKTENIIYTHNKQMGDFILRTLDNPERIVGYETLRAHIDEIDTLKQNKASDAWNKIVARNRERPRGMDNPFNRVSAYTTPEGFKFAHNRWVKNANKHYQLVQASSYSNPFLPEDYIDALKSTYPEELVRAYVYGEFVNLTSGTVYRSYNRDTHASSELVKGNEPIFVGMDFNVDHMAATIYVKRWRVADTDNKKSFEQWHAVDEISEAYDTRSVAKIIQERYPKNTVIVYPDSSGKSRSTSDSVSEGDISILRSFKFQCRYRAKNPKVKDRVMAMNAALQHGKVKINAITCKRTAECLEQQAYDNNGQPDKANGVDHQNDATTYPIAYEIAIVKPVAAMPIKWY